MTDMILAVRITADGTQLVGQLNAAEAKALELKNSMAGAATGTDALTRASGEAARSLGTEATAANNAKTSIDRLSASNRTLAQSEQAAAAASATARTQSGAGIQALTSQIQNFAAQGQGGSTALADLSQKGSEVFSAFQEVAGSVEGSTGKLAGFAGFLGGPLGVALGVAIPLIGTLVSGLFDTGAAGDSAKASTIDFTNELSVRTALIENFTGAIEQLNGATRSLINTQSLLIDTTRASAESAVAQLEQRSAGLSGQIAAANARINNASYYQIIFGAGRGQDRAEVFRLEAQQRAMRTDLDQARQALANASTALEARQAAESRDPFLRRRGALERDRAALLQRRQATLNGTYDPLTSTDAVGGSDFQRQLVEIDNGLEQVRDEERASNRRPRRPRSDRSEEAAARRREAELERVRDQGQRAADAISRINDRWSEQPTLIQQANEATRDLNNIIREAQERLAKGGLGAREVALLNSTITDAQAALGNVQAGLARPFNQMVEAAGRQRELQLLTLQGREREAEVLRRTRDLEAKGVEITAERRAAIEQIVVREEQINQLLARRDAIIGAYKSSIADIRSSLEDLFSGGSIAEFGRNLLQNAQRLRGRLLVEQLFGEGFRNLEQQVRQRTGLEGAVELLDTQTRGAGTAMASAGTAASALADTINRAVTAIAPGGTPAAAGTTAPIGRFASFDFVGSLVAAVRAGGDPDILVTGGRSARSVATRGPVSIGTMSPNDYLAGVSKVIATPIVDLLSRIDDTLGTRLAGSLGGIIQGGIQGYLTAGPVGGVLGALRGIQGLPSNIEKALGAAASGAQTGALISQTLNSLGISNSSVGASLGGAIGGAAANVFGKALGSLGAAAGPLGEIAGSIIGGLVGGLFKKAPTASATVTSINQDITTTGNNADSQAAVSGVAGGVQSVLQRIADALGGTTGNFGVSIGQRNDFFRVSGTAGADVTSKYAKGLLYDGQDPQEAVRIAVLNALGDGAVEGVSAAVKKALASSTDLDKALKEALKVQQVEDIIGGIGSTLERQLRQFEAQAKDRVRIANQYGFDVVKIEERNAEDRKKLVEQLLGDRVGSLQQLLKDFAFGNLFEGSAADRRTALIAEVAKAQADARNGVDGAAARLADLSRELIQTSRDAFGTAGPEFATDRGNAIRAAEDVIALENERIKAAQEAALGTRAAVERSNVLLDENNTLLAQIAATIGTLGGGGGPIFPAVSPTNVGREVGL